MCSSDSASRVTRTYKIIGLFCKRASWKRRYFFATSDPLTCVTWRIHMCDKLHSYVSHDSFICVTAIRDSFTCVTAVFSLYWRHDSFMCATWLIHMCDMTPCTSLVTCLIYMCDMTQSYVWHDSFICVTWLNHMCDMTHLYVWHHSIICVTWLIYMCDITQSYVW